MARTVSYQKTEDYTNKRHKRVISLDVSTKATPTKKGFDRFIVKERFKNKRHIKKLLKK